MGRKPQRPLWATLAGVALYGVAHVVVVVCFVRAVYWLAGWP